MDRRKELVQAYKERKTEAGVYRLTSKCSGRTWIGSTPNVKTLNGKRFSLNMGSHVNPELQKAWREEGEAGFEIAILEIVKPEESKYFDMKDELGKRQTTWLERMENAEREIP